MLVNSFWHENIYGDTGHTANTSESVKGVTHGKNPTYNY
jgi:hypothetical protein